MGTLLPSRRCSRGVSIARLRAVTTTCGGAEENVDAMPCRCRSAAAKLLMTLEGSGEEVCDATNNTTTTVDATTRR